VQNPSSDISARSLKLYEQPLAARRTGPLYNAFSYPTKIAPETIALYIATHTAPGDAILDVFAGSGTTGLAAKLCDTPTAAMKAQADEAGLVPAWGPRTAVLHELNELGAFVAGVMCDPPDPARFVAAAEAVLADAQREFGWIYSALDPDECEGTIRHIVWSDVVSCNGCGAELSYWDARVRHRPLRLDRSFTCPACELHVDVAKCERIFDTVFDPLLEANVQRRRRIPVVTYGTTAGGNWQRSATANDEAIVARVRELEMPLCAPVARVDWGDLYRSGYHRGISHVHHFYTHRNYLALAALWQAASAQPSDLQDALHLAILSFNASHATDMTRVVVKKGQQDFVLTGAQSGVLYVSGLPVEKNVFRGVRRKIATLSDAFALIAPSRSTVRVENRSSTQLDLADSSIDYVFTDPPFGDYIPYAELSQLNEAWLAVRTSRSDEVIVSPSQGKDLDEYEALMTRVLAEVERVMKPAAQMTLIFHSAHASIWQALMSALADARLAIREASVLDKVQASFKQVAGGHSVKGDAAILVRKDQGGEKRQQGDISLDTILESVVVAARDSPHRIERSKERLFSRFVTACLKVGVPVPIDAGQFYDLPAVHAIAK
jgi:16S rRNA G966 N2-methylase RsmD